jgi:hypothetical protein
VHTAFNRKQNREEAVGVRELSNKETDEVGARPSEDKGSVEVHKAGEGDSEIKSFSLRTGV